MSLAEDIKADRIEVLDVRRKTPVTDFFVVCTGTSLTHCGAIAERVQEKARDHGVKPFRRGDGAHDGWILVDFGDVILHVMLEEKRQFYDLESLWTTLPHNPDILESEEEQEAVEES